MFCYWNKHDFFGVSHLSARIGQWVDEKLLKCRFIGFDWLRMLEVALLKSKKYCTKCHKMAHSRNWFGMLIYKCITVTCRSHKQYKSIYKYIMKNKIFHLHVFYGKSISLTTAWLTSHYTRFDSYMYMYIQIHHSCLALIEKKWIKLHNFCTTLA